MNDLDASIGIVGAGCAGLAAAETLRELGYRRITLLEGRERPGGQTVSLETPGADGQPAIFEGGTVWAIPSSHITRFARRHGADLIAPQPRPPLQYLDLERKERLSHPFTRAVDSKVSSARRGFEVWRYLREMARFRGADSPGFEDRRDDESLYGPIDAWFAARELEFAFRALFPVAGNTLTGGYVGSVPALYYLKILALLHRYPVRTLLRLDLPHHAPGNAALWRTIAASHEVKYREPVQKIERGPQVRVHTSRGTHDFERVIWAAPLGGAAEIVDGLPAALLGRVRSFSRSVLTCAVRGLPHNIMWQVCGLPDGNPECLPFSIYEVRPGSGIYNIYSYLRYPDDPTPRATPAQARAGIEALLRRVGAELVEVRATHVWDRFFPHFAAEDLRSGPAALEELQGVGGVFYCGELLSHITVPLNVEYAVALVRKHFAITGDSRR